MSEPKILLSTVDDSIAMEKGRLHVAQALARDPEQRKMAEDKLGVEFCKRRWPEAYQSKPFFRSIVDILTFKA